MSKFAREFSEPNFFVGDCYVLSAEAFPQKADAVAEFARFLEHEVNAARVTPDRIRYGFTPGDMRDELPAQTWMTDAKGPGSKPVWVYAP